MCRPARSIIHSPLDVAISCAHHMGRGIDEAIKMMAAENVETPMTEKTVYEFHGSWSQHVWSWTGAPHRAIYVRHEDMLIRSGFSAGSRGIS